MNSNDRHTPRSEKEWELELRRDERRINRYFHELPVCIDLPAEEEFIFADISSIPELIPQNTNQEELRRICRMDECSDEDDMHDDERRDDENVYAVNDMAVDWAVLCVEKLAPELWNSGVGISCDFAKLISRMEEFNIPDENIDKALRKSVGKRMLRDLNTLVLRLSDISRYQNSIADGISLLIKKLTCMRVILTKKVSDIDV